MNRKNSITLRRHRNWLLDPPVVGGNGEVEIIAQACEEGARAIEILDEIEQILINYLEQGDAEKSLEKIAELF